MTQTEPTIVPPAAAAPSLSGAFVLFSLSLAVLLGLSQQFLLPRFTRIPVTGALMDIADLQAKETVLNDAVDQAETDRRAMMLPTRDPVFQSLQEMKQATMSPLALQRQLRDIAAAAGSDHPEAVQVKDFVYSASGAQLHIVGEVSGVGTKSMTVLANFIDKLRAESFVADFSTPTFFREETPDGFRSPFDITIALRTVTPQ